MNRRAYVIYGIALICAAASVGVGAGNAPFLGQGISAGTFHSVVDTALAADEPSNSGDANGDGEVNILDLQELTGAAAENPAPPEPAPEDIPESSPPQNVVPSFQIASLAASFGSASVSHQHDPERAFVSAASDSVPPVLGRYLFILAPHAPPQCA